MYPSCLNPAILYILIYNIAGFRQQGYTQRSQGTRIYNIAGLRQPGYTQHSPGTRIYNIAGFRQPGYTQRSPGTRVRVARIRVVSSYIYILFKAIYI